MKKSTITFVAFEAALEELAAIVERVAAFDRADPEVADWLARPPFFVCGEPAPTTERGRGDRVRVDVGWLWLGGRMSDDEGARFIAAKLAAIPGVEEVGAPNVDTMLREIWGVPVTLRLSQ